MSDVFVGATTTWMKSEFIDRAIEIFVEEDVGNFLQLWPALKLIGGAKYEWNHSGEGDSWDEWVDLCARNKIYTQFCHIRLGEGKLREYIEKLGDLFCGYNVGECEGLVGWAYNGRKNFLPEKVNNLVDARRIYVEYVNKFIRERVGDLADEIPIWAINSGRLRSEEKEGGVDNFMVELFAGDSFDVMISVERGMHRSLKTDSWGAYFAASYFGGIRQEDLLRQKRNRLAMYNAYIAGADIILFEGGVFHNDRGSTNVVRSFGTEMDERFNDASCQTLRKELKEFYEFTKRHKRFDNGPIAKVAFVKGYLDGFVDNNSLPAPLRSWFVYGQYKNEPFRCAEPERMWQILYEINKNVSWDNRYEYAQDEMSLSGCIPFGQYDVIDIEADDDVLRRYDLLIFVGWNTMTQENYDKLVGYVNGGGNVIISLAHLATNIRRDGRWTFINDGDVSQFCGTRIKGRGDLLRNLAYINRGDCPYDLPFLEYGRYAGFEADGLYDGELELTSAQVIGENLDNKRLDNINDKSVLRRPFVLFNRVGRGSVLLINSWSYPGDEGLYPIYANIIRKACEYHFGQSTIKVICRDKVRWAVYTQKEDDFSTYQIFLLNTDFDLKQEVKIICEDVERNIILEPMEFKIL